ncbi:MAG: TIGR03618 family F420-dependent PPOX class oxidoreductase [Actinobacteria bacterium]|nr:MAG: TIGR03618 family F420-dependent PPOX class oxidoreductase [Actinomycetota bacterium]
MKPSEITPEMLQFLRDRHLATLTTLRSDGSPHVVAVGFSYDADAQCARIITFSTAQKAINAARGGRAAVSQVDGGRWLTLEGTVRLATMDTDQEEVRRAVAGYAQRYQDPKERDNRVAVIIDVDRIMGRA